MSGLSRRMIFLQDILQKQSPKGKKCQNQETESKKSSPEGSGQMFIKRCITGQGDASVSKVFATQIQGLELRFPISILES